MSIGFDLCAVAVAPEVTLFPIEGATFVLLSSGAPMRNNYDDDDGDDDGDDDVCPSQLFELRGDRVVLSPEKAAGMPCSSASLSLLEVGGRFPDLACAVFYTGSPYDPLTFRDGAWRMSPLFVDGCADAQAWSDGRYLSLEPTWYPWMMSGTLPVGTPSSHLEAAPEGGAPPPVLSYGHLVDEGGFRLENPFAFGAGRDGTIVVGWWVESTQEAFAEHWAPGSASASVYPLPGPFAPNEICAGTRVAAANDIDMLAWKNAAAGSAGGPQPLGYHFDGAAWQRFDLPSALAGAFTARGSILLLQANGVVERHHGGDERRSAFGRALLDGEPIKLVFPEGRPPTIWDRAVDDFWIVSEYKSGRPADERRDSEGQVLLHRCAAEDLGHPATRLPDSAPAATRLGSP